MSIGLVPMRGISNMFGGIVIGTVVLISFGWGMYVENRVQASKRRRDNKQ